MTTKSKPKNNLAGVFLLFLAAIIMVAILAAAFAYKLGYKNGLNSVDKTNFMINGEVVSFANIESMQLQNQLLKKESDTAKQERDISLNNLKELRKKVNELKVTNLQLQHTIDLFTKSVIEQGGIPLQVIGAKIEPLPENAYEYRFDVSMLANDGQEKRLVPELQLLNATSFVGIPIKPSSYQIKGVSYIRGRFVMPDGFSPKQVKLVLSAGGERVEELYDWTLGAEKDDMPLSLAEIPQTDNRPITE